MKTDKAKVESYLKLLEVPPGYLNIMGYADESESNGLGCRAILWVQGCLRECEGCDYPASWSFDLNELVSVDGLVHRIISNPSNEGVTFSGGEPFWQAPALTNLAKQVKAAGLNVIAFTGFTLEQLQEEYAPAGAKELLAQLDVLIDGPYIESLAIHSPDSPITSRNQRVHVFNPAFKNRITWDVQTLF